MRPDYEFPDENGNESPFDHLGKNIVRIWKVAPKKAAVVETEDREFLLLILKDALGNMPRGPYSYNYKMKGHLFGEHDMELVKLHHPRWVKAWQKISGLKGKDYLPYWYEEQLILSGDHPFRNGYDVQRWLKNNKWKEDKKNKGWFTKRVGQGLVRMYGADGYSSRLRFYAYPTGRMTSGWGRYDSPEYEAKREEFQKQTERELPIKGSTGKDLEATALEVSQAVKAYRPKLKRRVLTDKDKQRIKDFNEAVREDLLGGYLNVYESNEWTGEWKKGRSTRELADLTVWGSGGLDAYERYFGWDSERTYGPSGFGKKEVGRLFRKVLEQMLKEGLLEYDRDEKKWWKSKTASRVANRHLNNS